MEGRSAPCHQRVGELAQPTWAGKLPLWRGPFQCQSHEAAVLPPLCLRTGSRESKMLVVRTMEQSGGCRRCVLNAQLSPVAPIRLPAPAPPGPRRGSLWEFRVRVRGWGVFLPQAAAQREAGVLCHGLPDPPSPGSRLCTSLCIVGSLTMF